MNAKYNNDERGIVYILVNESMYNADGERFIKIGSTKDLDERLKNLNSKTAVPAPFEVYYACEVDNYKSIEKKLHGIFADERYKGREFFLKNPERVVMAISMACNVKDIIKNDKSENGGSENEKNRLSKFSFKKYKIPLNAELTFSRDENEVAIVVDTEKNKIKHKDEITALSAAAKKLLGLEYGVRGPDYWMYENETLTERRIKMDREEDG
ncbi:MAG: GIY-YIG nuclease family protein [Alphaproteobacteria bacterium]